MAERRYHFSDWATVGTITYLGYVDDQDAWYIQEVDSDAGTSRYRFGNYDYSTNWAARADLTYVVYSTEV